MLMSLIFAVMVHPPSVPCRELCSPQAIHYYGELLAASEFGRKPFEKAGFLVREGTELRLIYWEGQLYQKASHRGPIPAGCLAIVHTHPRLQPDPSPQDTLVAQRLGLPVLVLTPNALRMVDADGSKRTIFRAAGWWLRPSSR